MDDSDEALFAGMRAVATRADLALNSIVEQLKANYVRTQRDTRLDAALRRLARHALLNTDPTRAKRGVKRHPGRGLVLAGPSGAGKSRIVDKCLSRNPMFSAPGRYGHGSVLLKVSAPKPCSLIALGQHVMEVSGLPLRKKMKAAEIWTAVRDRLKTLGVVFLWIDEFQHTIDRKNPDDVRDIRDTLKTLLENEWPVYLILSGLPHIVSVMEYNDENDVQVIRRYRFQSLPDLDLSTDRDFLAKIIDKSTQIASLTNLVRDDPDLVARLHHAALHQFGLAIELINEAVEAALIAGDSELVAAHFAQGYEERTGSSPIANPYVVGDWWNIDCHSVLRTDEKKDDKNANGENAGGETHPTDKNKRPF
jgi:hypothetical protein